MNRITRLADLAQALRSQADVYLNRRGDWKTRGSLTQKLFGGADKRRLAFAKAFIGALDTLETVPVRFSVTSQAVDFSGHIHAGAALSSLLATLSSPQAQQLRFHLEDRLVALQYRLESVNGGLDALDVHDSLVEQVYQLAADWKAAQNVFYGDGFSSEDVRRLREVSRYPAFVERLSADADLREKFFQWTIRDQVNCEVFIQYPALRERLMNAYLTTRIGRFGGKLLLIQRLVQDHASRKIVTLQFEGNDVNILDEQRAVTFRGNYRMTIKQALAIFAAKMQRVGDLEFFSNGINNWNSHLLAWWDADAKEYHQVDVGRSAWWKELPILEALTLEQAQKRYGAHLDGQEWTLAVNATRTTRTLNPDASHAFVEMVIPMTAGQYAVYPLGKFATTYAGSLFDSLKLFTATLRATVAYPDENIFYTHRERARRNFALNPNEGMRFMESIRRDIVKSRTGSFTYQIESENCAKWIQDKMEEQFGIERFGDLFRVAMLDTEPPGAAASLFALLRRLPRTCHSPVLSVLHYMVGAWRGVWVEDNGQRVWVSITTTKFWQDKVCYLPAKMHQEQSAMVFATIPVSSAQVDAGHNQLTAA